MEKFMKPELKVIQINTEDIIQTSGDVTPIPTPTPTATARPGIAGGGGMEEMPTNITD